MKYRYITTSKVTFLLALFCAFSCCTLWSSAHAEFQRTKIAVLDFELIGDKIETTGIGSILAEWFVTGIVKSGRFDVVERAMLQKIISEQKLSTTGMIDEASAATLGKILGVKVIISGSALKLRDTLEINARVISVESGSIIAAENIRGAAISDLHTLVDALIIKILKNFPLTGYIVKKDPKSVLIDLGLESGLTTGTEFIAYKEGEVIKHPKTGEVLDVEQIVTGKLRVSKVSKNVAEGEIQSEEPGGIQYGHLVKSIQKESPNTAPNPEEKVQAKPVVQAEPSVEQPPKVVESLKPPEVKRELNHVEKKKPLLPVVVQPSTTTGRQTPPAIAPSPPPPAAMIQNAPEKQKGYKIGLFPWVMSDSADSFTGVLVEKILIQIKNTPGLILTKSYYKQKGVDPLTNVKADNLFNVNTPDLRVLQEHGKNLGIDIAILGQLRVYCRFSDSCTVRGMNFVIANLTSGKIYSESGAIFVDSDARDTIDAVCDKAFKKFTTDMKL